MNRFITTLAAIFIFTACHNHDHHHGHDHHDHHHDDVFLHITAYSDDFEIYAELEPPAAGHSSGMLIHITSLNDFKPADAQMVKVELENMGEIWTTQSNKPVKPGVFNLQVRPQAPGYTRFIFHIMANGEMHTIDAGSFRVYDDAHRAIHAIEDLQVHHPAAVIFTKEQSWVIDFATTEVKAEKLGVIVKTVGEVMPSRGDHIVVNAPTSGIVSFIGNNIYEGISLQNGTLLMNISGEGLAESNATLRYQEAQNNFLRSQSDFERINKLYEERIVSQREWLQAKNEFDNARALYENLSRSFSDRGHIVKSPAAGFISAIYARNGQFVEAGQPLLSVARNNQLIIRAELQQHHAHLLSQLATATIGASNSRIYTLDELGGNILAVGQSTLPANHLFPVHIGVSESPGWKPGMLLDVYLQTQPREAKVVVPNGALIEEQGNYFVFVQLHPESFEKRQVTTGNTDGLRTEILRGLNEGERVITRGAIMVKIASASAALDPHAGHVH